MLFNSLEFAIFFPIVTILFFMLPHKFRWLLLLLASCYFYMFFKPIYILILFGTIVIDYFAGIWIAKQTNIKRRKKLLLLSIVVNVGVLVVFKYFNFLAQNINTVIGTVNQTGKIPLLNILLPIGLSFHTFQAMSYTIEVYRGNQQPEKHFGIYALYVMFYPQLVAGPIERPQNVLHQFHEKKYFDSEKLMSGLRLILWGLFKKCVIADRLAIGVDNLYNHPFESWSGGSVIIGTIFFAIQIYCDFSGYSEIAIGTARCMGFDLMANFKQPYFSKNISEFWTRWHISLSTWFRDYVYIPLGGNRVKQSRIYLNLFLVFLISGVWHGANYTFIIWGALHGSFLVVSMLLKKHFPQIKLPVFIQIVITFCLTCIAWIYFRAANVTEANHLLLKIFTPENGYFNLANQNTRGLPSIYLGLPFWKFAATFLGLIVFFVFEYLLFTNKKENFDKMPKPLKWSFYYALIIAIIFLGVFETNQFIYFQF